MHYFWSCYVTVELMVTLSGCTSRGHVTWLKNFWLRYMIRTYGHVNMLYSYGHVIWLYKLWSHLTAQLLVTLGGYRTYGQVT